ncbi:MAG: lamin tail domain-containing protein [Patescibacteria group bacterium]
MSIFFCFPFFAFGAVSGDVVINEVAYDLEGTDDKHEWVELYNASAQDIDITGWKFNDGSNHIVNAPPKNGGQGTMIIPASGYAALADDAAVFLADHPGFSGTVIDTVMSLNNTSATLTLLDENGTVIDVATYQKESGAAGNGMTLARSDAGMWKESAHIGGSPGVPNGTTLASPSGADDIQTSSASSSSPSGVFSQTTVIADAGNNIAALAGTEVILDASRSTGGSLTFTWNLGDGIVASGERVAHYYPFAGTYIVVLTATDGRTAHSDQIEVRIYPANIFISEFLSVPREGQKGWVELYNGSEHIADLSGWGIGTSKTAAEFIFSENTFLAPRGFLVLQDDVLGFTLPAQGELSLWYPYGQAARRIVYQAPAQGLSIALNGNNQFFTTASVTPGARNVLTASAHVIAPSSAASASAIKKGNALLAISAQEVKNVPAESFTSPVAMAESINVPEEKTIEQDNSAAPTALASRAFGYNIYFLIAGALGFLIWIALRRRPAPVTEEEGMQ